MSDAIDDARSLIQSRLAEIETETRRLERAAASMGEGSRRSRRRASRPTSSAPSRPSRPKRRPSQERKAPRRAARGQRRDELLAAVKATPGARPSDLARRIGIKPTQVHALIAKARGEKLVVQSGKGYALSGKGLKATL